MSLGAGVKLRSVNVIALAIVFLGAACSDGPRLSTGQEGDLISSDPRAEFFVVKNDTFEARPTKDGVRISRIDGTNRVKAGWVFRGSRLLAVRAASSSHHEIVFFATRCDGRYTADEDQESCTGGKVTVVARGASPGSLREGGAVQPQDGLPRNELLASGPLVISGGLSAVWVTDQDSGEGAVVAVAEDDRRTVLSSWSRQLAEVCSTSESTYRLSKELRSDLQRYSGFTLSEITIDGELDMPLPSTTREVHDMNLVCTPSGMGILLQVPGGATLMFMDSTGWSPDTINFSMPVRVLFDGSKGVAVLAQTSTTDPSNLEYVAIGRARSKVPLKVPPGAAVRMVLEDADGQLIAVTQQDDVVEVSDVG